MRDLAWSLYGARVTTYFKTRPTLARAAATIALTSALVATGGMAWADDPNDPDSGDVTGTFAPTGAHPDSGFFYVNGDAAHYSAPWVSAHGWWTNINSEVQKAVVNVRLQEFDPVVNEWVYVTLYSGTSQTVPSCTGKSYCRATAKADCHTHAETKWRQVVTARPVTQAGVVATTVTGTGRAYPVNCYY